jgi:spore coat protein H
VDLNRRVLEPPRLRISPAHEAGDQPELFSRGACCTAACLLWAAAVLPACNNPVQRPDGWSEATHGNAVLANYAHALSSDVVHTLQISIAPQDFAAMQAELSERGPQGRDGELPDGGVFEGPSSGAFSAGGGPTIENGPRQNGPVSADGGVLPIGPMRIDQDGLVGNVDGPGGIIEDPMYVAVEVREDANLWTHVGMRYKGNSTLAGAAQRGKPPFRLNFDKFEADFPEIKNQRFYGFDELAFSPNFMDDSMIRECFATELLRDRGVPAARCAFYRVFVDTGAGAEYWGVYSVLEDPSDRGMLEAQLGGRGGNLYKPDGLAANFTLFDREAFVKKTNEEAADWSDIEATLAALHATSAVPEAWRANLEARFHVLGFLRWLAVNTAMVNWDSYGMMTHNYYLYASPSLAGRLQWIPWDHNEALRAARGPANSGAVDSAEAELFHTNVGSSWPLISLLLADPLYRQTYRDELSNVLGGLFEIDAAATRMQELHALIEPYVVGDEGESPNHTTLGSEAAFLESINGLSGLVAHIASRHARVSEALAVP